MTTKPKAGEVAHVPTITRAIPEIVKTRGIGAIREWLATDRPWISVYGCSYLGLSEKRNRPNVAGFWFGKDGGWFRFRPLATLRIGQQLTTGREAR